MYPGHRVPMTHRDPYASSPANHPTRANSPPFKILCITNITQKVSDGSVKEALASDFGRFGDISVSICHDSGERLAYIYFRNYEEAREARNTRIGTLFFDRPIEIEPIYEPDRSEPPGGMPPSAPMMMPGQPVYSPGRRSISPPMPYPHDMNGPPSHRRALPPRPYAMPTNYPGYPYLRGSPPPPEFAHAQSHASGYMYSGPPQGPPPGPAAPGPPLPYERRINYDDGGYNHYPSPHAMNASSPYSTSPHEHYRSAYPSQAAPPGAAHHSASRGDRERIPSDPRSPRSEAYHLIDQRGPPPNFPPQEEPPLPPRRPRHRSGRRRARGHRGHHGEPPARFMSREYRREKFGKDGANELEDGKPSRVLLINNIDISKTEFDLRDIFESFGIIEDMEVRKVGPEVSSAIIRFSSMDGAYKAKTANNGRSFGSTRCRIVYGKVSASRKLWIGGLSPSTTVPSLERDCARFGDVVGLEYTSGRPYCYVEFETANQAQFAAHHLKSTLTPASERKIRVEFVDQERSERLVPKQDYNPSTNESGTKSRAPIEQPSYDTDNSPQSMSGQKRALSPAGDGAKRVCQFGDLPLGINTFKQERLDAAAAAKARSSSTTSSHPSERIESNRTIDSNESSELNNNGDSIRAGNGNLDSSQTPNSYDHASHLAPTLERLSQCTSIREVVDCCLVSWPGKLALKTLMFPAQLYLCSGSRELIDTYLSRPGENGDVDYPLLCITQRWRLHPQPKLEMGMRRMQSGNLGILIITARQENQRPPPSMRNSCEQATLNAESSQRPASDMLSQNGDANKVSTDNAAGSNPVGFAGSVDPQEESSTSAAGNLSTTINDSASSQNPTPSSTTQSKSIRNLISYLGQKDAAGVITLSTSSEKPPSADNPPKLLYTFPPGEFALNLLERIAPNLAPESIKEEFLLGVISRGNLEGKI